ncbi:MAG: SDR family NAD(P)-dependent oxidoreductase [Halioglobus sp.]|nr:SDR family NAD(P)-dependent oxidoreductase [Halioglobus sp.]
MKTTLITGKINGIGNITAEHLLHQGHRLVLANRNRDKFAAQCQALASASGNDNIE